MAVLDIRHLNLSATATALILLATACTSVPLDYPRTASSALDNTDDTQLAIASREWRAGDPLVSGFYPLTEGKDAFGARLQLMDWAESSIDAQYFLMKPDNAGLVFSARLIEAADRGVRVRLLLDDIFTTVDDASLALLNEHPNIEVRIFNPISRKGIYAFNYIGNFKLANRRMHNKSFTIDNQVAVVGGRNIAVEYFQLDTSGEFFDFDMLVAGPVVTQVSASFDTYWNHKLALPFEALDSDDKLEELDQKRSSGLQRMSQSGNSIYADATHTQLMEALVAHELSPFLADSRLIVDDPQKLLKDLTPESMTVINEVIQVLNEAQREIILFTPYFIPGKKGVQFLRDLRARGVRVVVVTNSLATNNHTAVHSAYSSYRKDLLDAGVELWEARADAARTTTPDGSAQLEKLTLHTKGILIDREQVFVGSLNLDPRSTQINTEMGLLINSAELGELLTDNSIRRIPRVAYYLEMDEKRNITWHAVIEGVEVVEDTEPQTSGWRRFQAWFLKILPEKQL